VNEALPKHVSSKRVLSCPVLLACATVIALLSLFSADLVRTGPLIVRLTTEYFPLVLGPVSMVICFVAGKRTRNKGLVVAYALFLAPFTFSYPAWFLLVWVVGADL